MPYAATRIVSPAIERRRRRRGGRPEGDRGSGADRDRRSEGDPQPGPVVSTARIRIARSGREVESGAEPGAEFVPVDPGGAGAPGTPRIRAASASPSNAAPGRAASATSAAAPGRRQRPAAVASDDQRQGGREQPCDGEVAEQRRPLSATSRESAAKAPSRASGRYRITPTAVLTPPPGRRGPWPPGRLAPAPGDVEQRPHPRRSARRSPGRGARIPGGRDFR